jgi:hypothetical protein
VVNGASAVLSKLRSRFIEAPAAVTADVAPSAPPTSVCPAMLYVRGAQATSSGLRPKASGLTSMAHAQS